jgi:hypothetical protein
MYPYSAQILLLTQELQNILRKQKVNWSVHKRHPLAPILSQKNPVHTIPFHFSNIRSASKYYLLLGLLFGIILLALIPESHLSFSSLTCVLHVLPISSSLTCSFQLYLTNTSSFEGPHYGAFTTLLPFHLMMNIVTHC